MPPKQMFDPHLRRRCVVVASDGLSFPRSLVIAIAFAAMQFAVDNNDSHARIESLKNKYYNLRKRQKQQLLEAGDLMRKCGLGQGPYTKKDLDDVGAKFPCYRFELFEKSPSGRGYDLVHVVNPDQKRIAKIAFHNARFDFWQEIRSTVGKSRCRQCHQLYTRTNRHYCPEKCTGCNRALTACPPGIQLNGTRCQACHRFFKSDACFNAHKLSTSHSRSVCERMFECTDCKKLIVREREPNHDCERRRFCKACNERVPENHSNCYWNPPDERQKSRLLEKQKTFKLIMYDLETVQNTENEDGELEFLSQHFVNVCCWSRCCDQCFLKPITAPCTNCGPKTGYWLFGPQETAAQASNRIVKSFLEWLLHDALNDGVILLAHNGSRFDSLFMLNGLIALNCFPTIIAKGAKLFSLIVQPPKHQNSRFHNSFTFKDSYLFFSMPLATLPKTFGFSDEGLKKGTYPYALNMQKNFGRVLPGPPDIKYFNVDYTTPAKKREIEEFLETIKNKPYDCDAELFEYCLDDVEILHKAVVAFLKVCLESSGYNPYVHCCTIASYSHFILRTMFLERNTLALIPETGIGSNDRQSILAINYIQYISKRDNVQLQYKLCGGEKVVHDPLLNRTYKLDCWNPLTNEVTEVHGCMFHGCEKCFHPHQPNPIRKPKLNSEIRQETEARVKRLREMGFSVIEVWEHDVKLMLERDKQMKQFFVDNKRHSSLIARNGFMGGRTQSYKLYEEATSSKRILYLDFNSLYPSVCATGKLPVGQPNVITKDFLSFDTHCPYNGLIFADLLPPTSLSLPVIGAKINGKLIFTLCRTCAYEQETEACTHTRASQRYLPAMVVTSVELEIAITRGYKLLQVYEVWHYDRMEEGAYFRNFVLKHIAMKQENSGWPVNVTTEEQKRAFCEEIKRNEGYEISPDRVQKNPSMRTLAKLICNTSYGKMGEANDKEETRILQVGSNAFCAAIDDQNYQLTGMKLFGDNHMAVVNMRPLAEKVEPKKFTNVVIASFVTSIARSRLFLAMERVGASRLLYVDTDSLIFTAEPGEDVLEDMQGSFLGRLQNEVEDGYEITHFCSTAPKAYALKIRSISDHNETRVILKQKGITLTNTTLEKISFEAMEQLVRSFVCDNEETIVTKQFTMQKTLFGSIKSVLQDKSTRVVMNKLRVVKDTLSTLPFGYAENMNIVMDL